MEHEGPDLARIHRRNNDAKFFCHFTGFLEGIAASGYIERGEVEPLLAECVEFVERVSDGDANDILEDFDADLLECSSLRDAVDIRLQYIDAGCEKSLLNRFLGFCRGISCDGRITEGEAQAILDFLRVDASLSGVVGVRQIETCCEDALSDGIIDELESAQICDAIGEIVGACYGDTGVAQTFGVANYEETRIRDFQAEVVDRIVVLTGKFRTSPRSLIEEKLSDLGVIVSRSVSSKTDYLIIGGEASRDWIEMNRGTKFRAAQKLRQASARPFFVSESQILRLIK